MASINLPSDQQAAISDLDEKVLRAAIDRCLDEERIGPVHGLGLGDCGPHVSMSLQKFQQTIGDYGKAKAHAKRERTRSDALRAGSDLMSAVQQMKRQLETELRERELFYIDDLIMPPLRHSPQLSVRLMFRWRTSTSSDWKHGKLTYTYDFIPQHDFSQVPPKRKPSSARSASDLQERLHREWEHLRDQALFSLRDFFRTVGDGSAVPEVFAVRPSTHGGGLDNFSCNFWQSK